MSSYRRLRIEGHEAVVPESIADRDDVEDAVESLLNAALPHYNEAVQANQAKRIPEALNAIYTALRLFPYSPRLVEFGLLLSITHGDFDRAQQLLKWGRETGMGTDWPDYQSSLRNAVDQWNRYVGDTTSLRKKYRDHGVTPSYRELLLLAHRAGLEETGTLTEAERSHLDAYNIEIPASGGEEAPASAPKRSLWGRTAAVAGLTGLLGIAIGVGGYSLVGSPFSSTVTPTTTAEDSSETEVSEPEADSTFERMARANRLIAQGDPLAAVQTFESLDAESAEDAKKALRRALDRNLYSSAVEAWEQENFENVVQLLSEIDGPSVGDERERLYMHGVSAAQVGDSTRATEKLRELLESTVDLSSYPHYEAQAAYLLVRLLSNGEAKKYARLIEKKYEDTLYYNSVVRAHLSNS
jgi:tetratricopeptide (TPR) repeat protein